MRKEVELLTKDDFLYHQLETINAELDIRRPAEIVLSRKAEVVPIDKVKSKRVSLRPKIKLVPDRLRTPLKITIRVATLFTILWSAGYAAGASALGQHIALSLAGLALLLFVGAPAVAALLSSVLGSIFSGKPQNPCGGC